MVKPVGYLLFFLAFAAAPAFAWPPTYGSEFNFSSDGLDAAWRARGARAFAQGTTGDGWQKPAEAEQEAARKFGQAVQAACGGECDVTPHRGKFGAWEYAVKFRNGYSFNISVDPACVEIQTAPETLAQIREYESLAQKYIFDVARKLGLRGDASAHFNVGFASAFGDDAKAFLRFFANYQTMQELASGALGEDFSNAPPLSHLKAGQRAAFREIVDDVNAGKLKSTKLAAQRILDEVYTWTPAFDGPQHYQGFSLKRIDEAVTLARDRPFELRAPRQPDTAHERTLLAELFEKRLEFDRNGTAPVAFVDVMKRKHFTDLELANRFRMYLLEMGLDWDKYKAVLPASLRAQPADGFIAGRINWGEGSEVAVLKEYIPFLGNSAWARARMFRLLSTPEARASARYAELLEAIRTELGDEANAPARAAVANLLAQLQKNPHSPPAACPLHFQRLLHTR